MKETPLLFKDAMVRALLEGRKTQTRRIVQQPIPQGVHAVERYINLHGNHAFAWVLGESGKLGTLMELVNMRCPYGQPGDRIWVRETVRFTNLHTCVNQPCNCEGQGIAVEYCADGEVRIADEPEKPVKKNKKTPSILMPRWASRITLEITNVRVERLRDITDDDAMAEGIEKSHDEGIKNWPYLGAPHQIKGNQKCFATPRQAFESLWDSIHNVDTWHTNPWVWVIEFKQVANSP